MKIHKEKKVLKHPSYNGVQIFFSFTTSNARKYVEDLNNDRIAMISKEMMQL